MAVAALLCEKSDEAYRKICWKGSES